MTAVNLFKKEKKSFCDEALWRFILLFGRIKELVVMTE